MYRLLLAETRTIKASGIWNIWASNLSANERTGLGIDLVKQLIEKGQRELVRAYEAGVDPKELRDLETKQTREIKGMLHMGWLGNKPEKVVVGMVDRKLYTFSGWIIEKWKPAATWGNPADWYGYTFQGECAIGEFPHYGEYELCAGPTPKMPSATQVEDAIRQDFREIDRRPANANQRVVQLMEGFEREYKRRQNEAINRVLDLAKEDSPLMNRLSLGAGLVRQEMAKRAGLEGGDYGN